MLKQKSDDPFHWNLYGNSQSSYNHKVIYVFQVLLMDVL